jgi:hypothetical protein
MRHPTHRVAWSSSTALHEHWPIGHIHIKQVDLSIAGHRATAIIQDNVAVVPVMTEDEKLQASSARHHYAIAATASVSNMDRADPHHLMLLCQGSCVCAGYGWRSIYMQHACNSQ